MQFNRAFTNPAYLRKYFPLSPSKLPQLYITKNDALIIQETII